MKLDFLQSLLLQIYCCFPDLVEPFLDTFSLPHREHFTDIYIYIYKSLFSSFSFIYISKCSPLHCRFDIRHLNRRQLVNADQRCILILGLIIGDYDVQRHPRYCIPTERCTRCHRRTDGHTSLGTPMESEHR